MKKVPLDVDNAIICIWFFLSPRIMKLNFLKTISHAEFSIFHNANICQAVWITSGRLSLQMPKKNLAKRLPSRGFNLYMNIRFMTTTFKIDCKILLSWIWKCDSPSVVLIIKNCDACVCLFDGVFGVKKDLTKIF